MSEVHVLERGTDQARKEIKDQIPGDRKKDAASLARELRWRLRLLLHGTSDDETESKRPNGKAPMNGHNGKSIKRKRLSDDVDSKDEPGLKIKNFVPKTWEEYQLKDLDEDHVSRKYSRPAYEEGWTQRWLQWDEKLEEGEEDPVDVDRKKEVMMRVRRTANGVERQRVERTIELWRWGGDDTDSKASGSAPPPN